MRVLVALVLVALGATLPADARSPRPTAAPASTAPAPAASATPGTASVDGTVTAVSKPGPVFGICVSVAERHSVGPYDFDVCTNEQGQYHVGGLAAGDYVVRFADRSGPYANRWWLDADTVAMARTLTLTAGQQLVGIDAHLVRKGTLSGKVTRKATGAPLGRVRLRIFPAEDCVDCFPEQAFTADDGTYRSPPLHTGSYVVRAEDDDQRVAGAWSGGADRDHATRIAVTPEHDSAGVDVAAPELGRITGRVLRTDGRPAGGVFVSVVPADQYSQRRGTGTVTASDGTYAVGQVPEIPVVVSFGSESDGYVQEWWDDSPTRGGARSISVGAEEVRSGIDATVAGSSTLSGRVTLRDGSPPYGGASIYLLDRDGNRTDRATSTGPDGSWSLTGVKPGTYVLSFSRTDQPTVYHRNVRDLAAATRLVVGNDQTITGLDDVVPSYSTVSGRILDSTTGSPVAGSCILFEPVGPGSSAACTDPDGRYTMVLRPGRTTMQVEPPRGSRYVLGSDEAWATGGITTSILVPDDADVTGVDQHLRTGAIVSGTLTDAATGERLYGCALLPESDDQCSTTSDGRYATYGVRPGTYTVTLSSQDHVTQVRRVEVGAADVVLDGALTPAGVVSGDVDQGGFPGTNDVADAELLLENVATGEVRQQFSDSYGSYVFREVPVGDYRLHAAKDGTHVPQWVDGSTTREGARILHIERGTYAGGTVHLARLPEGRANGTVKEADSLSAYPPRVRVCGTVASSTAPAVCDPTENAFGSYDLALPAGTRTLTFEPLDGDLVPERRTVAITAGQTTTTNVVLHRGGTLRLGATDARTGAAVGAWCYDVHKVGDDGPLTTRCGTGAEGSTLGLDPGRYTARIRADGYQPRWVGGGSAESSATVFTVAVGRQADARSVVTAGGVVTGTIRGADGRTIGACVEAFDGARRSLGQVACSGAHGTYRTTGLPPGAVSLVVTPAEQRYRRGSLDDATTVAVAAGTTTARDLVVPLAPVLLTGTATDELGPLAGACASAYPADDPAAPAAAAACADAGGAWSLAGLRPGRYAIAVTDQLGLHETRWRGGTTRSTATAIVVEPGPPVQGLDVVLPTISSVRGVVTDEIGRPLVGACATAYDDAGTAVASSCSTPAGAAPAGTYVIPLAPGSYRVGVADPEGLHATRWIGGTSLATAARVTVVEHRVRDHVDASLDTITTVRGTVRDRSGTSVAGACVYLYREDGTSAGIASCARADGTYALQGMAAGRYVVRVADPGARFETAGVAVVAAARQIVTADVVLPRLGSVSGTITSDLGQPVVNGCAYLDRLDGTYAGLGACVDRNGRYAIAGVPPGQYKLAFYGPLTPTPSPYWWKGASSEATATVITVDDGGAVTGIDGVVPLVAAA